MEDRPRDLAVEIQHLSKPIAPGESFVYDFVAEPAGPFLYHSHVGLQIDRGLIAPLIVEERNPHVD